jgi:capsular exopolysaccharide synthesis family protein
VTEINQDVAILTEAKFNTHFAEAYRTLRANINFSSVDRPVKTILVTSAGPREGKTTTAANLAIITAQAARNVVVVDADFRRPSLHHILGISPNGARPISGLSNAIVGQSELEDVILPTQYPHLYLVPAGVMPPNPSELLSSQKMKAAIDRLGERADVVIVDSPPCLLYADAYILSRMTDGVLYVLRAGAQDKAAQRRVMKQFQQAKARVLGVVFNAAEVEESASSYAYYYPQSDGHDKERQPTKPPKKRNDLAELNDREIRDLRERIAAIEAGVGVTQERRAGGPDRDRQP